MKDKRGIYIMKIKEGFVLREVAGQPVVIAVGEASKTFHGMINLNGSGKRIWEGVEQGKSKEEIAKALTTDYEVAYEKALADTEAMIGKMKDVGVIENE